MAYSDQKIYLCAPTMIKPVAYCLLKKKVSGRLYATVHQYLMPGKDKESLWLPSEFEKNNLRIYLRFCGSYYLCFISL